MEMYTCIFVVLLFAVIIESTDTVKPKSVNLALETVLEFDNKENSVDIHLIDNVQNFLENVKSLIVKPDGRRRGTKPGIITDFLQEAAEILQRYDDDDVEDFVSILANELKSYNYKGCKFHELIANYNVRRYSVDKLREYRRVPGKEIKKKLANIKSNIENDRVNYNVKKVLEYMDSLYSESHRKKFKRFLRYLDKYGHKTKRFNLNLVDIIRTNVRSLLFDYYTNLTQRARNELKHMIDTLWTEQNSKTNNKNYGLTNNNDEDVVNIEKSNDGDKLVEVNKLDVKKYSKKTKDYKFNTHSMTTAESANKIRFISLYPEAITTEKVRKKKTKHHGILTTKDLETRSSENISKTKYITSKIIEKKMDKEYNSNDASDDDLIIKRNDLKTREYHTTTKTDSSKTGDGEEDEDKDSRRETDKKFRTSFKSSHISTEEGLTIESFEDRNTKHSYRRGNVDKTFNNTDKPIVDNVLKRIVNLENDMKDVKSKILGREADSRRNPYDSLVFNSNPSVTEVISTTAPVTVPNSTFTPTNINGTDILNTDSKNITSTSSTTTSTIFNTSVVFKNVQLKSTNKTVDISTSIDSVTKDLNISNNMTRIKPNTDEIDYLDYNLYSNMTVPDNTVEIQPTTFPRITKIRSSKNEMILGEIATDKAVNVSNNNTISKRDMGDYYKSEPLQGIDNWYLM